MGVSNPYVPNDILCSRCYQIIRGDVHRIDSYIYCDHCAEVVSTAGEEVEDVDV